MFVLEYHPINCGESDICPIRDVRIPHSHKRKEKKKLIILYLYILLCLCYAYNILCKMKCLLCLFKQVYSSRFYHQSLYIQINHLVYPWSSFRVCGSRRSIAGGLYGPMPSFVAAAILTEYITPDVKLANIKVGEEASAVILVNTFDMLYVSKPRTIIW